MCIFKFMESNSQNQSLFMKKTPW